MVRWLEIVGLAHVQQVQPQGEKAEVPEELAQHKDVNETVSQGGLTELAQHPDLQIALVDH